MIDDLHAQGKDGDQHTDVVTGWSLVHGLAALLIDGPLHALCSDPDQVRVLAEGITEGLVITT